ncbi:hydantoinase B/oxoprolinase family protein [Roseibium salinum]|nr:hydantoinase B/oxoprolinase family protein [Roseibium salinum]
MSGEPLDPISLEIAWNGLKSITDECFLTLMRSAFSTNVKERHDHSTAIADAKGRLIVQAEQALPIHLASMGGPDPPYRGAIWRQHLAGRYVHRQRPPMWRAVRTCRISTRLCHCSRMTA